MKYVSLEQCVKPVVCDAFVLILTPAQHGKEAHGLRCILLVLREGEQDLGERMSIDERRKLDQGICDRTRCV